MHTLRNSTPRAFQGRGPLRIALIYAAFGVTWILVTDLALDYLVPAGPWAVRLSVAKGWFYVGVTALLVYLLVSGYVRKLAASSRALAESEQRHRHIVETVHEGLWITDAEGRLVFVNPRMAQLLGCRAEELVGRALADFVHAESQPQLAALLLAAQDRPAHDDLRFRRRDGRDVWALVGTRALLDEHGRHGGCLGVATDVTERRRLEEELRHAQKMEALGLLAGGVAHDFNNILTVLYGHVDVMRTALRKLEPPPPELLAHLDQLERFADRATVLTRQLLAFTRRQVLRTEVLDLAQVLEDVERMLRRLLPESIELHRTVAPDTPAVRADAGQIEQIIVNLAVNARDAMPAGGTLYLEAAGLTLDAATAAALPGTAPGSYAVLTLRDTGIGMTAETRAHIFEPFFTTKPEGRGTGLGLSTVLRVVRQLGGAIDVQSDFGQGATFRVFLPAAPEAAHAARRPDEGDRGGHETVLLCEDNDTVRELTRRALEARGYRVLATGSGEEAQRVALGHAAPIHLLATDVVLPGIRGPELAVALRQRRPELAVLFISGYTATAVGSLGLPEAEYEFLEKPFSTTALLQKVRAALDARRPTAAPALQ